MSKRSQLLRTVEVLGLMLFFTGFVAHAQTTDASITPRSVRKNNDHRHHDILIGLCAGQKLATLETPIILPVPVRGQAPVRLDDATKTALKSAMDECYQQMMGSGSTSEDSSSGGVGNSSTDSTTTNLSQ